MGSSNDFIPRMNIPAPELGSRFADGSSSGPGDESGWSLSPDEDPSSVSRSQPETEVTGAAHVLIVEDNSSDVELLQLALAFNGLHCDLTVVSDGAQAIAFVDQVDGGQATCPALVILDVNLPKHSGFEVLERLRRSLVCPRVPVVVLSSSGALKDKEAAAALGADRFISKPSDVDEFMRIGAVMRELLESPREPDR